MSELATAEVKLEVDFDDLDEDVKKGLEARVRKAAAKAETELKRVQVAAAKVGDTLEGDVGGGAEVAASKVRRAARKAERDLSGVKKAADDAGAAVRGIGAGDGTKGVGKGLDELPKRTRKAERSASLLRSELAALIAVGAAVAPALVAGGAGVAAFGALAVPAIAHVVAAQTEMADRWDGLTRSEKIAAAQTSALVVQFKSLSREIAPDALRVYNGVLANTAGLLPKVRPLAEAAADALVDANQRIGQGLDSPRAREFFAFLQTEAGPAVDQVVTVLLDFAAAGASLIQALAPLASTGLGVVSFVLNLLTAVSQLSPELVQLVAVFIALRSPLGALGGAFSKFSAGAKGASVGARLLNIVMGSGGNLYIAAGTALAFFAVQALTAKTAVDSTINSINGFNRAMGNNIKGYESANKALASKLIPTEQQLAAAARQVGRDTSFANVQLAQGAVAADSLVRVPITAAMDANRAAIERVRNAAQQLVNAGFAPSTDAAIRLADAAGVNLAKALDENGTISASAASKIATYSTSVSTARDTTVVLAEAWKRAKDEAIGLTAQTQALQEVFDRFLNPNLALLDATNRLKEVQNEINTAFKDGKTTALERQQLLSKEVTALRDKLIAEQRATGGTKETTTEVLKLLPALSRLAGNSETGRGAVIALARSLEGAREDADGAITVVDKLGRRIKILPNGKVIKLKAEADTSPARSAIQRLIQDSSGRVIDVFVNVGTRTQAHAGATGGMIDPARGFIRRARGGPSGQVRGPGTGTSDSIPALLSNGEYVINAKQTRRYLGLLHALNAGRFAAGGLVGGVRRFASGGRVSGPGAINLRLGLELPKSVEKALARRIQAIGLTLGAQLSRSLVGSPSEISTAIRSLEKKIKAAFVGIRTTIDDRLIKRLEIVNSRLTAAAKKRDQLAATLEEAASFRTSTIERTAGFAALTGFDDTEQASAASLAATLRDRLAKIKQFAGDIQALSRRGLDKGLIRQLVEGGPEQAGGLARTLATSSRTALAEINSLQRRIDRESADFGTGVTDTLFDAGAAAGKGFLTGLKSQRAEIVKLMTEIAKSVSTTVRKTLKIKSPSRVLRADAVDTLRGYVEGLRTTAARVRAAMIDAVQPSEAVRRAARLPAAAASSTGSAATLQRLTQQTIHAPITLISPDPTRAGESVLARLDRLADATR